MVNRITVGKSNGETNSFDFSIPAQAGTYTISFPKEGGGDIIAEGKVVVNENVNTYRLDLVLSNGTTLNAGTFTTPAISAWRTLFSGSYTDDIWYGSTTFNIQGLKPKVPTRLSCTVEISDSEGYFGNVIPSQGFSWANEENNNGAFSKSGSFYEDDGEAWYYGSFEASITALDGKLYIDIAVNGTREDYCGDMIYFGAGICRFTITRVAQYY